MNEGSILSLHLVAFCAVHGPDASPTLLTLILFPPITGIPTTCLRTRYIGKVTGKVREKICVGGNVWIWLA
jgi:hypothetical protein